MKKRYKSRGEVEYLIDKVLREQAENAARHQKLKDTYTSIFQWMAVQETRWDSLTEEQQEKYRNEHARAIFAREEADRAWKSHSRFETRLKRLKATLAALETETFPFMEDKSVVLQ